ncbi:MAG: septum formation protein Maf [Elusimicrobia bacterium]|nr:septum formation protein Maf [Elusimicrobiota bacterium]
MIILASASPRRKTLLRKAGVRFRVEPSRAHERTELKHPSAIVRQLALRKALETARRFPGLPVLGADTIVVCKGRILGKPTSKKNALERLELENGSWQKVYTGVAAVWLEKNRREIAYAVSRCKARKLTREQLLYYAGRHMDKAGAYAVQDGEDPFIDRIEGGYDNVVGLPVALALKLLRKIGAGKLL